MGTVGETGTGTTDHNTTWAVCCKFTAPDAAGTISDVYVYINAGAATHVKAAIYLVAGGVATTLLGDCGEVADVPASTWAHFGGLAIAFTSANIAIAAQIDTAGTGFRYKAGGADQVDWLSTKAWAAAWPNPFGHDGHDPRIESFYATYTTSGGISRVASHRLLTGVGLAAKTVKFKQKRLQFPKFAPRIVV